MGGIAADGGAKRPQMTRMVGMGGMRPLFGMAQRPQMAQMGADGGDGWQVCWW